MNTLAGDGKAPLSHRVATRARFITHGKQARFPSFDDFCRFLTSFDEFGCRGVTISRRVYRLKSMGCGCCDSAT